MSFKDYSKTPSENTELGDGTYIGPNMLRNKVRPALQQLAADGKDLADTVIPPGVASDRAGKFLSFDGSGNAVAASGTGSDSALRTDLAAPSGSAAVAYAAPGSTAAPRTIQAKLRDGPLNAADYYKTADGENWTLAIHRARDWYFDNVTNPPVEYPNWGKGVIELGRGNFNLSSQLLILSSQGGGIIGHGQYSTALIRNFSAEESGIYLEGYVGYRITDLLLKNISPTRGLSYGLFLNPIGGGGSLHVGRVQIEGFNYGAYIAGDIVTGNGDKTLWDQVTFICNKGWSNGINKQAIGHTFLNPNGGCSETFYEYGGAGSTVTLNGTINVFGSLIRVPENAGTLQGGMFAMYGTKTEYQGHALLAISGGSGDATKIQGARVTGATSGAVAFVETDPIVAPVLTGTWAASTAAGSLAVKKDTKAFTAGENLILAQFINGAWVQIATATCTATQTLTNLLLDARPSVKHFTNGGSAALFRFDEVWHTAGPLDPQSDERTVLKIGDGTGGSDRIIVQMEGSYVQGSMEIASAVENTPYTRTNHWPFRNNVVAPSPATVKFQGPGSHVLVEWTANQNVPVDQYRGGQDHIGAIQGQREFLWRHDGKALINSGSVSTNYGGRFGGQFAISGFPAKLTITGLAVFIDNNPSNTDTKVEWFKNDGGAVWTDATDGNVLLGEKTIPAEFRGLYPIVMNDETKWQVTSAGNIYVRITKPAAGQATNGALVPFYFGYVGT